MLKNLFLPFSVLLFIFVTAFVLIGITRIRLDGLYNYHQAVNSWKLFQIDKNNLNPFSYDLKLDDLSGGRFVSYWDPPLSYFFGLVTAKLLSPLGDLRYLASVRLVTHINFFISLVAFYFLLRLLTIRRFIALAACLLLFTHRQITSGNIGFLSLNLPGFWALILPLCGFISLKRKTDLFRSVIFGLTLGLSYLQNPYYGWFVSVFLFFPVLLHILTRRSWRKLTLIFLSLVVFLSIIGLLKGGDIYKLNKEHPADPESRDYNFKQLRVYRPWYHFIPPSDHFLYPLIGQPTVTFIKDMITSKSSDPLTLWLPESDNQSYLGILNVAALFFLCLFLLKKHPGGGLRRFGPYFLGFVILALVSFRADMFFQSRHIIFPWYRLQNLLPFTQLRYVSVFTLILFYIVLAYLADCFYTQVAADKGNKRRSLLFIIVFTGFVAVSFFDTTYRTPGGSACTLREDTALTSYLHSRQGNRLFIQISGACHIDMGLYSLDNGTDNNVLDRIIGWDARYYQIYHRTPIYAPDSLSWFDSYSYSSSLNDLRTLRSILTDDNNDKLSGLGVDEIVLVTEFTDANNYWNNYLKTYYKSKKPIRIFGQSIVFLLRDDI